MNQRMIGTQYENQAAAFLLENHVLILERNFRNRFGEIDIIGCQDGMYLFIEVKYRKSDKTGDPAYAVTIAKQTTICKVADYYRVCHGLSENTACRFDVITILGQEIKWYQNAFPYRHR